MDSAMSKEVGNRACILAYPFNSSRQYFEGWASQFPFLHNVNDTVPPSEACLYSCINRSLTQDHKQCFLGLS